MKIRQHEPLRVPQGWNGQDKSFVIQLERVLTDLYRLVGIAESEMVTEVAYNPGTKKLTFTIDGETKDIVSVATLDGNGKIPASQLPSYVDDVEEYASITNFPATGEADKIYVAKNTGFTYRWSGTQYVRLNTYDPATQSASGLMSAADKTKLDGIAAGAQVNPGDATQSASGLMSSADKTKLDGIAAGATANIGTITEIKMNGASKGTSGVVDLGTVITAHQDISGKLGKIAYNIGTMASVSDIQTNLLALANNMTGHESKIVDFDLSFDDQIYRVWSLYQGILHVNYKSGNNLYFHCAMNGIRGTRDSIVITYNNGTWVHKNVSNISEAPDTVCTGMADVKTKLIAFAKSLADGEARLIRIVQTNNNETEIMRPHARYAGLLIKNYYYGTGDYTKCGSFSFHGTSAYGNTVSFGFDGTGNWVINGDTIKGHHSTTRKVEYITAEPAGGANNGKRIYFYDNNDYIGYVNLT